MGLIRKSLSVSLSFISCFTSWNTSELHQGKRNQRIGVLWTGVQRQGRQVFMFASKGLESSNHATGRIAYTIAHFVVNDKAHLTITFLPIKLCHTQSQGQAGMGVLFSLPLHGQVRNEGLPLGHHKPTGWALNSDLQTLRQGLFPGDGVASPPAQ